MQVMGFNRWDMDVPAEALGQALQNTPPLSPWCRADPSWASVR